MGQRTTLLARPDLITDAVDRVALGESPASKEIVTSVRQPVPFVCTVTTSQLSRRDRTKAPTYTSRSGLWRPVSSWRVLPTLC